jgi:hypothetical protein
MRILPTINSRTALLASIIALGGTTSGLAQMPGVPVLQNAFVNPGWTAALNLAGLGGASSYGAAGAWSSGAGATTPLALQLSAGVGFQTRSGHPTQTIFGARANVPFLFGSPSDREGRRFAASLFAGYGVRSAEGEGEGGQPDSAVAKTVLPIGATFSYRTPVGATRGFSLYVSPIYEQLTSVRGGSVSAFRASVGLDIAITPSIGATLGIEFGQTGVAGSGRPTSESYGFALSYTPRRSE